MSKRPRVKLIKNNIKPGQSVPVFKGNHQHGQWVDQTLAENGLPVDKTGIVDFPDFGIDNKAKLQGSTASHTVGSMTISAIKNTPEWEKTRFWKKLQNQNQITIDTVFNEVSDVTLVDMDIDVTQNLFREGYEDCRQQLLSQLEQGYHERDIRSKNNCVIFDGYGHPNSYRMRIRHAAMKKIKTIAATQDVRKRLWKNL